jgi:hypothetical protein
MNYGGFFFGFGFGFGLSYGLSLGTLGRHQMDNFGALWGLIFPQEATQDKLSSMYILLLFFSPSFPPFFPHFSAFFRIYLHFSLKAPLR